MVSSPLLFFGSSLVEKYRCFLWETIRVLPLFLPPDFSEPRPVERLGDFIVFHFIFGNSNPGRLKEAENTYFPVNLSDTVYLYF